MNPNRLARELRDHPENLRSGLLPGGSLVSAVLDRMLMTWSDRGGASRIFGEIWSEYCWQMLNVDESPVKGLVDEPGVTSVIRLDSNPRIAMQAGRNKLPNPDFLVVSEIEHGAVRVRAIDAKFAIDRVRRTQVSPDSMRELIELPGSLVRKDVLNFTSADPATEFEYEAGAFVGPRNLLNEYYHQSLTSGPNPKIPASEFRLIHVPARELFERTEEFELIALFQDVDRLPEDRRDDDILIGMYYLRLACAARWFEQQSRAPLLTLNQPNPVSADEILSAARHRLSGKRSAYQVIHEWSTTAEKATELQSLVQDAARLPVRMSELRQLVQRAGFGEDKKRVRMVRGKLERAFLRRLVEEVGEIPANPSEPVSSIIDRVRTTSRSLKAETMRLASVMVERVASEASPAGDGDS